MATLNAFFSGFAIAFSFILAIGAQNAFVLRQGLKRQHVLVTCLTCGFSDSLLITMGVIGHREFSNIFPRLGVWIQSLGAAFLIAYGVRSIYLSLATTKEMKNYFPDADDRDLSPVSKTILLALAFTWLNPHVYVDTFIIIGSLSQKFPDQLFGYTAGAVASSYVFFFSLGYGARILSPWFRNPRSWKILDGAIGVVMLFLAVTLLRENF